MSRKAETTASQQGGKFKLHNAARFWQAVGAMGDGRYKVVIEKVYRKRSLPQNAYYHSVICQCFLDGVLAEWGETHSADWAHEQLKQHCNYTEKYVKGTGELVQLPQTTRTLTTVQFMEYQERCIKLIAEWFGIAVPAPNEQTELFK